MLDSSKKQKTEAAGDDVASSARTATFLDMPLDCLGEVRSANFGGFSKLLLFLGGGQICIHLGLADLISLAKTSKAIRAVLLSKAAHFIWSATRRAMGLPIFPDMGEIKFAHLLYGTACKVRFSASRSTSPELANRGLGQDCGNAGLTKLNLELKYRGCDQCIYKR